MKVSNEQRDTMRQIHSLALAAGDCGLVVSVSVSARQSSVWHDVYVSRGDERLYSKSVVIDKHQFADDATLEQQRDALVGFIAQHRKQEAAA